MLQSLLTREIDQYLLRVAAWNAKWFHKPKFHILLHLPEHIRRFGPAMLFATEAFESYNAVIRAKSIHSNRQAPSRDIALAFAQGNRVRHLLSGGYIQVRSGTHASSTDDEVPIPVNPSSWVQAGSHALALVHHPKSTVNSYLGLKAQVNATGTCVRDDDPPRPFDELLASGHCDKPPAWCSVSSLFVTCTKTTLVSGDVCSPSNFVIVRSIQGERRSLQIGRVEEIVKAQRVVFGSPEPDFLLVRMATRPSPTRAYSNMYRMPYIELGKTWEMIKFEVRAVPLLAKNLLMKKMI